MPASRASTGSTDLHPLFFQVALNQARVLLLHQVGTVGRLNLERDSRLVTLEAPKTGRSLTSEL